MKKNLYTIVSLASALLAGSAPTLAQVSAGTAEHAPALKEVFRGDFLIGVAVNARQVSGADTLAASLIPVQFNTLTPENVMKAEVIHPGWNTYDFTRADELVAYAKAQGLAVNAHTLIWHSQLPACIRQMKDRDSLRTWFTGHITTLAARFDGKVASWDVVNEALEEDGTMRKSIFLRELGPDFVVEAFRLAAKAAPHTKLYYNDYNIEQPKKRAGAIALIKKIQAAGVRIDGVGIQGHWRAAAVPFKDIEESIREFSALGIAVMFTELDLGVLPNPWDNNTADISQTAGAQTAAGQTATGQTAAAQTATAQTAATAQTGTGRTARTPQTATAQTAKGQTATGQTATGQTAAARTATRQTAATAQTATAQHPAAQPPAASASPMNPYREGLPDSVANAQADAYASLFRLFLKYPQAVTRVTFWGVDDGSSWLNNWPIQGRTNYPLLFDRKGFPKKAFSSVITVKNAADSNGK